MKDTMPKINYHGLFCIVAIALILVVLATSMTSVSVLYVVFAIVLYAGAVFYIMRQQETQSEDPRTIVSDSQQLRQIRILYGAHIAFIFLFVGTFVDLAPISQFTYFIVSITFALLIPFIIVTR